MLTLLAILLTVIVLLLLVLTVISLALITVSVLPPLALYPVLRGRVAPVSSDSSDRSVVSSETMCSGNINEPGVIITSGNINTKHSVTVSTPTPSGSVRSTTPRWCCTYTCTTW